MSEYTDPFTPEVLSALSTLRNAGFAVCVFTPEELDGENPKYLEGVLAERGNEYLVNERG